MALVKTNGLEERTFPQETFDGDIIYEKRQKSIAFPEPYTFINRSQKFFCILWAMSERAEYSDDELFDLLERSPVLLSLMIPVETAEQRIDLVRTAVERSKNNFSRETGLPIIEHLIMSNHISGINMKIYRKDVSPEKISLAQEALFLTGYELGNLEDVINIFGTVTGVLIDDFEIIRRRWVKLINRRILLDEFLSGIVFTGASFKAKSTLPSVFKDYIEGLDFNNNQPEN